MKTGYASTLVARSRGQAPLLLPATPSRFEPDVHAAALHDDVAVAEHTDTMVGQRTEAAVPGRTALEADRATDTAPLLGWRSAPTSPPVDDFLSTTTQSAVPSTADERSDAPGHPPPPAAAHDADARLMPPRRAPIPDIKPAAPGPQYPEVDESHWAGASARATPEPSQSTEHVTAARRVEGEGRSHARRAAADETGKDDPPIVVRIGRLDVRAVQAPPAPRPQPRPRPGAGPTLEERLAARDRQ